jgi:hypothetical protein
MPAKSEWLLRLPEIRAELEHLEVSVVDRSVVERIFGLRRRRAIELLHEFGGYQTGRTFLVERRGLLQALEALQSQDGYVAERRRRERLGDVVDASREHLLATQVRISVRPAKSRPSLDRLGPGVHLAPGMLSIEFLQPLDLLEKLYGLAQAITHDFEKFEGLVLTGR